MAPFVAAIEQEFLRNMRLADGALASLEGELFFARLVPSANSAAVIVKHLSGSMRSRWTDFLTSDGEKPDRDRDAEFILGPSDTRAALLASWEDGWNALRTTLGSLEESDLLRTVTIRGEPHQVTQALVRGLSHVAYHVGQLLYLSRSLRPDAAWLTIPPGQSAAPRAGYLT